MEAGQGRIDRNFGKPKNKDRVVEPIVNLNTDTPGIKVLNFEPRITWKKNPLPTKIPEGLHGGIVFRKHVVTPGDSKYVEDHQEIYVPGIGYGTGSIVSSGTGSVLLGSTSLGSLASISLFWIVLLLIITAVLWAIRVLIAKCSKRSSKSKFLKMKENKKENWIEEAIDKDTRLSNRDPSLLSENANLINAQPATMKLISSERSQNSPAASLSSFGFSARPNTIKSLKGSTIKKASNDSILSYASSLVESATYGGLYSHQGQCIEKTNQVAVNKKVGIIFTASEKRSPSSYMPKNLQEITFCKESSYNECVEMFLLFDQQLLVVKMKNNNKAVGASPFVVQIWSTDHGDLYSLENNMVECTCVASIMDIYLMVLDGFKLDIIDVQSNTIVHQVIIPFTSGKPPSTGITMQSTKDMSHIIVSALLPPTLSIFVYNFDHIQQGRPSPEVFSRRATSFAVLYSAKLIIASQSNEVIMWNFVANSEHNVLESTEQDIMRLLSSPTGHLALVQFVTKASVFQTKDWSHIYNIPVFSEQVCAMVFSSDLGSHNFLATSLDSGIIQVYHSYSGKLIRTITTDKPVTFLFFDDIEPHLLAVSDRASHYRLSAFSMS